MGFKSAQTCYFLPRWYFLRGRSPAYPFFRKEKIHPHRRRRDCDAESPERVLLRSGLSAGVKRCATLGIPLPSASLLALPRRFVRSGIQGGKRFLRRTEFAQESPCGAESVLHAGWSFFLYEKSVLRELDHLRGSGSEVCTDLTPPLFRP